jgi:tetratricopeptide (TPR) repeat protein
MISPKVLLCYSHQDEVWKDRLVTHLGVLRSQGLIDLWNDNRISVGEDWYSELQENLNTTSAVILLISAHMLTSEFILNSEVSRLLQRRTKEGLLIIPIIARPCAWEMVGWLKGLRVRPSDGKPLSLYSGSRRDEVLAQIANEVYQQLESARALFTAQEPAFTTPDKISIARLPLTGRDLFGRDHELLLLDKAWADPTVHILSMVAWGGVGKSALINHWLQRMSRDNYRGAERVYGWSFYSQGTTDRAVTADRFIEAALVWFGDYDPHKGSLWERGERLAHLIRQQRTLLVLDGLEPLQYAPGPEEGRLKDQALQALLSQLAGFNTGLCVITTRVAVTDLITFEGRTAVRINLEHLSPWAGAQLLKAQGVIGNEAELEQASREFGGHPLALTLLGSYLNDIYRGDISRRTEVSGLEGDVRFGGQAQKVLASYEKWFGEGPELAVLNMIGLFDRPASEHEIAVLRAAPVIQGLTEPIQGLDESGWQRVLSKLRRAQLLAPRSPNQPGMLDTHPLVREHFAQRFRSLCPDAWREGHNRLYEHLKSTTKEFPDTIEEMAPLYAAVAHGCAAGRYHEVLNEVYWRRIRRESKAYNLKQLGTFSADLAALTGFFDRPWMQPVSALFESDKVFVLAEAGYALRALGRLTEATQPLKASLEACIVLEDWYRASTIASNLSQLYLTIGDLSQALTYAQQSINLTDRSGDSFQLINTRTLFASVLHQVGRFSEAEVAFAEAEQMQKALQPHYPFLYSMNGFRYCELLLDQNQYEEVQNRVAHTLQWIEQTSGSLLDMALDHLSAGKAYLMMEQEGAYDFAKAAAHLQNAVDSLRQTDSQDLLIKALLARAELHLATGEFNKSRFDLEEAMEISTRSGMGLCQADCQLGYARLYLAQGDKNRAKESLALTKNLIERSGYYRQAKEVSTLLLIEQLEAKDIAARVAAVKLIAESGSQRVLPSLVRHLVDKSPDVRSAVQEALEKLPSRDFSKEITEQLMTMGKVSLSDLPVASSAEKIAALVKYARSHSDLDLMYSAKLQELRFRNIEAVQEFQRLWNVAASEMHEESQSFYQSVHSLARHFSTCVGVSLDGKKQLQHTSGKLFSITIDATAAFVDIPVYPQIPMLFLQGTEFREKDLDDLRHVLSKVMLHPGRVVFLIIFAEAERLNKARRMLNHNLRQNYAYNTFVLDRNQMVALIGSTHPLRAFEELVLSEIDLISVSPFTTDGPTSDEMFFGRENEIWEISEHADKSSYALIGGRKVGKTSILQHLANKRLPCARFQPFYFTCELIDQSEPTKHEFLESLVNVLLPQLTNHIPGSFAKLLTHLPHDKSPVFLIDEADRLIPSDRQAGWPLFGELRALAQQRRCQFVFAGERFLRDAVIADSKGRLYNFPKVKKIGCLDFRAVEELVSRPMKELKIDLADEGAIIERIWDFTGGHPNVVQRLCQKLIESINQHQLRRIEIETVNSVISDPGFQDEDFLRIFWDQATLLERIISLVMARQVKSYTAQEVHQLTGKLLRPQPKRREVEAALYRLVELRSILKVTTQGYVFAINGFPEVIAKAITAADTLSVMIEEYGEHGDVIPGAY